MKKIGNKLAWAIEGLSAITGWIAALCLVAAALIVTEGVLVRKFLGISTIWQIEASVFLLILSVFVGAPLVQKNEHHLNVDLILIHLSARTREVILIVVSIFTCLLALLIAYYAWPMWWETVVTNEHSESLWGPPLWIPYLFLPVGMTLLFLQYIVHISKKISALRKGDVAEKIKSFELRDIEIPESGEEEREGK
ncbi:MAG: TRAP transporter small permease [Desulfobacterales bacterium]|nr:TRAP transporter small permease [Desulfobacterales bacterium]